jgi:5-oxoprolinase (ATP-hydrolysing) subunit A
MDRRSIDLNGDLGEGCGDDAALMPWLTSANIACGAHAGDAATMARAVALAREHGVAIGAHPGYADREHFGRVELGLPPERIRELVRDQLTVLRRLAPLRHVKPHGALYNRSARDRAAADAIAVAVAETDAGLVLFGLAGGALLDAGRAAGLRVAAEGFADRTYQADGSLTPRTQPDALHRGPDEAVAQALGMALEGRVRATDGSWVALAIDTLCVHGDGPDAVALASRLRRALETAGIRLSPPEGGEP